MLCEYLQAMSYVFNVRRIFQQISPMCTQIHTIFWSGNRILFNALQISPASSMHIGLLRSWGHSQYFTILAMQGNGEKIPQPSIDNYLNLFCSLFLAGWFEYQYWRWIQVFLWCFQPVWEPRKHGHYLFHQSVFLWKTGGRESRGKEQTPGCKAPSGCCFVTSSICILPLYLKAK